MNAAGVTPLIGLALLGVLSTGCAGKRVASTDASKVQVVLLKDEDSTTKSAATVTTKAGALALTEPNQSTTVLAPRAPSPPVTLTDADIQRQFGALLADLPSAPRHFNLYFRTDTADLTDESRATLPDVLRVVASWKVPEVTVIGHTDTTGSVRNNYALGLDRAQTVKAMLVKAGLDGALIEVESHGEADLLRKTPDNTPEPRNRRVEITIR